MKVRVQPADIKARAMQLVAAAVDNGRLRAGKVTRVDAKLVAVAQAAATDAAQLAVDQVIRAAMVQRKPSCKTLSAPSAGIPASTRRRATT